MTSHVVVEQLRKFHVLTRGVKKRETHDFSTKEMRWGTTTTTNWRWATFGLFLWSNYFTKNIIKTHLTRFVTKHVHTYCTIFANMWCKSWLEVDRSWTDRTWWRARTETAQFMSYYHSRDMFLVWMNWIKSKNKD